MGRKNRTGLWLSLATLSLAAVLVLTAYNSAAVTPPASSPVTASLDFNNSCLACHIPPLPDFTWYCHNIIPSENYSSRMYLEQHLDWLTPDLHIPSQVYAPPLAQPAQSGFEIHLFNGMLFPDAATITPGTTVTWTNLDIEDHTLVSLPGNPQVMFAKTVLKPGESISYTFQQAGVFSYSDSFAKPIPGVTTYYQIGYGKITVAVKK